jgi:hypothetical protein
VAVIWLTESVRDEHREALEWLNRRTDTELHLFAVTVGAVRIDQSKPAYQFKSVVSPNEWQRSARETADRQGSERGEAYRRYFQVLIDELREQHRFTGARTAQPQNWYSFPSGFQGLSYSTSFAKKGRVRAELYIDHGDADQDRALFDSLLLHKAAIEEQFGEPLKWERIDDSRASRIAVYRDGHIERTPEKLPEIRAWAIARLLRFKEVFSPWLDKARKGEVAPNKPLQPASGSGF